MATSVPRTIQPWSGRRLALIVPALLLPALVLAQPGELSVTARTVVAAAVVGWSPR